MCVVLQHHLGKGTRCASPLHPPGLWRFTGIEPVFRATATSGRCIATREEPPSSPKTPMAISLRPGRLRSPLDPIEQGGDLRSPPAPPSTKGRSCPPGPLTNPPRIGCAPAFPRWTTTQLRLSGFVGQASVSAPVSPPDHELLAARLPNTNKYYILVL